MKTILLVDDELAIIEALTEVLTWEGYKVVSASNGQEGLATLAQAPADLVLLDYMMPVLDGIQTLRALRADPATKDIPVVMMTAAPAALPDEIRRELPVLRKPFDVNALLDTIERKLASGSAG
jgi:CheY-like chemotaxis protein